VRGDPPAVLIQLGDLHIGADWVDRDPLESLAGVVEAISDIDARLAAILVLGDLAEHGSDAEYVAARAQLHRLDAPVHVAMGNRDDRERLRRNFDLAPAAHEPLDYAIDLDSVRLLVLDTTIPGHDGGRLGPERLAWLEHELSSFPTAPTLLAMHHPPLLTGSAAWDRIALDDQSRGGLGEVLDRHPQVRPILAGHLHRPLTARFAGRPVIVSASTYAQFPLTFTAPGLAPDGEPPGYVAHVVTADAQILSSFHSVA
jgi:3',5'-cyclic AMP phosphodiesterase CpdA